MNKFKNSSGAYLLSALFYETNVADKSQIVYTLKDEPHNGYPSLYQAYMAADDPTEYSFAVTALDSLAHWERLSTAPWFKPYVTRWRRELELRIRSRALLRLKEMTEGGRDAFQVNKFLLEGKWKAGPEKRRPGAPSQKEIKDAAHEIASEEANLNDDLQRLRGLN